MKRWWEIVHIPDKLPIPPDQQPTVDVIASIIQPQSAHTLVRRLNQIAPLENLRHVKRVHKKALQGGETQLSAILCLASENGNQLDTMQTSVQELVNSYQLSPFIAKVCKYAASSKEEWEEQCKLWPTSYHPPTYNIEGITGFNEEDSESVFSFIKYAIQLAKSSENLEVNAAVIVDPSVKQVMATAIDQTCSSYNSTKHTFETSCCKRLEASASHGDADGALTHETVRSKSLPDKSKQLYAGASCLLPWRSSEQQSSKSLCDWHPLRHATIVAIESSAARDRHLFPNMGKILDKSIETDHMQTSSTGSPTKRQKPNSENVNGNDNLGSNGEDSSLSDRPYLCTGFDMYLVWEPCIMCAMALVHQRIRRIFFAFPNTNAGALGTVHRLQGEKSLNHHYAVFRVMVPQEVLGNIETSISHQLQMSKLDGL